MGVRAGVDLDLLQQSLAASPANSLVIERDILPVWQGDYDESFTLDLVTKDLVAHVESTWRAKPGRASRGLLGISMGGHAALRIAFTEPEVFVAVATHSAMLLDKIPSRETGADNWHMRVLEAVFGAPIDPDRWKAADPLVLAQRANPKSLPALRFDCGREDRYGLARGNTLLHETLDARGIPHTFAIEPGNHGYEYVKTMLAESLRFLGDAIGAK